MFKGGATVGYTEPILHARRLEAKAWRSDNIEARNLVMRTSCPLFLVDVDCLSGVYGPIVRTIIQGLDTIYFVVKVRHA